MFSHYLFMIFSLYDDGIINKKFVIMQVKKDTVEFLRDYIWPLERAIADEECLYDAVADLKDFDFFYNLYNIESPWYKKE